MIRSRFFQDDHGRSLRVAVFQNGEIAVHLVDDDGDVIPLEPCATLVKTSSIEKPFGLKELREKAKACPLFNGFSA